MLMYGSGHFFVCEGNSWNELGLVKRSQETFHRMDFFFFSLIKKHLIVTVLGKIWQRY